jgi:Zn finger protein HypA/HybF involved in hydrogenase expression
MQVIGAIPQLNPLPAVEDNADVYMKMSKYVFINQVKDLAKCKNCDQPLEFKDFKADKCLACGEEIKYGDEQTSTKEQD